MPLLLPRLPSLFGTAAVRRLPLLSILPTHRPSLSPFERRGMTSSSSSTASAVVKGCWKALEARGDIPKGRSSTACGVIGDSLFVFSGENTPRVPLDNEVHALSLTTSRWARISPNPPTPCPRVGHAATVLHSTLYIYGGRTGAQFADQTLADLWSFNPSTSTWTLLTPTSQSPSPPPLSYHTLTSSPTDLYLFGGCLAPHGRSNALWSFSPSTSTWTQLSVDNPSGPQPCGGATAVYVAGAIHVLFGYNGKEELSQHFTFDLTTLTWSSVKANGVTPTPRSVTDAVYLPVLRCIWIWGGEYTPSAQGHDGAGLYHGGQGLLYDVKKNEWREAEGEGPTARGWFNTCAGEDGKSLVLFGGFDGKERLNDVHIWRAE